MINGEEAHITVMDIYRGIILGLMGLFYGFLIFLMFL
jgi:hypothetical protein